MGSPFVNEGMPRPIPAEDPRRNAPMGIEEVPSATITIRLGDETITVAMAELAALESWKRGELAGHLSRLGWLMPDLAFAHLGPRWRSEITITELTRTFGVLRQLLGQPA
jgi:hypothetical protein